MSMMNFERNSDHIDSTLAQALNGFDSPLQQGQSTNSQPTKHEPHLHHTNHRYGHLPIDPSIGDASSSTQGNHGSDSLAQELIAVRNTAQAAVNSSAKLNQHAAAAVAAAAASQQHSQSQQQQHQQSQDPSSQRTPNKITKPRVNKPGQKFGAKKKSWVWNWFIQDPSDCNVATCECCGKVITRLSSDKGSPKKLGEHLKTHKIDKLTVNSKRDSLIITNSIGPNTNGNQSSATSSSGSGSTAATSHDSTRHYYNTLNPDANSFKQHPLSTSSNLIGNNNNTTSGSISDENNQFAHDSNTQDGILSSLSFDRGEFDQSPYTQSKFQKDLMKFLVDNKLPLSIVKTSSFRQVIYTLKPEAIPDLNELNHLYSSLLEVIHNEKPPLDGEEQDGQVENEDQDHDENEDRNENDSLTASTGGWV